MWRQLVFCERVAGCIRIFPTSPCSQQSPELHGSNLHCWQGVAARGCIEAIGWPLYAEDRDEAARVVEDRHCDGCQIRFAFPIGLAPTALTHLIHRGLEHARVGDRVRSEGFELIGDHGFASLTEGEHDLADGGGVRHARSTHQGGGADAATAGHVVDGDTFARRREREGRRLARCGRDLLENWAGDRANIEALQDVCAELEQAHAETVTPCRRDPFNKPMVAERAE